jgi:hypothetical protein
MSGPLASYLVCHGCGTAVPNPASEHCPCRCQHADRDDGDPLAQFAFAQEVQGVRDGMNLRAQPKSR